MDVRSYVGLEFVEHGRDREGIDCFGLLRLIYLEQFDIELPACATDYAGTGRANGPAIAALFDHHRRETWREIAETEIQAGDVLLLKLWNHPMHVGVVFEPGRMLHAMEGVGSCVARYNDLEWKGRKIAFYRHARLDRRCPTS